VNVYLNKSILIALVILSLNVFAGVPAIDDQLKKLYDVDVAPLYKYVLTDLNGNGINDAVVLITDSSYCGSGGCNLVILKGQGSCFKLVSSSTIVREPIYKLDRLSYGWHVLGVFVSGGGVKAHHAEMRFNGSRYPVNPTVQPELNKSDLNDKDKLLLVSSKD